MKISHQIKEDNLTQNMKQVIGRILQANMLSIALIVLLVCSTSIQAQDASTEAQAQEITVETASGGDPVTGKSLFNTNCASCHRLDKKSTGPALRNVEARLEEEEGLGRDWLDAWIRNSAGVIASGDEYGKKIYDEYNGTAMTAFPQLSDQDISDILAYTAQEPATASAGGAAVSGGVSEGMEQLLIDQIETSRQITLIALAIVFLVLAFGLYRVNKTLKTISGTNDVEVSDKTIPIWKAFAKNQFLVLVTSVFFLLLSGYFVYGFFMQIGIDQGYQPIQPIHFSHKIHAGDNGIDCKYCHSSARVSKHSGIPSLNVCMNCHKSIDEYNGETSAEYSKAFYDGEIQKLYKAAGWNTDANKYTGESQPVKWVRIHNLPDFAYFNHSQHVTVGGIECQTCHGPVEEMEILEQHSPLTMGWCISCHRETNVKVKDNAYYAKIHEELSKKYGVDELTAAQMGGLECGKCHY